MQRFMLALAATTLTIPALPAVALAQSDGYYHGKTWRDGQGRLRCKRSNGTTGLIVGAAGGALIGRAIDTRGERATGTIVGAAAGALLGRQVERSRSRSRCR
ncbi:glycine zipper 2TM domain-containing protein [Sphingomonas sp. LY29]|uniref:glycine zipper 2TM domain-containing protein n=1 Tax=unclassified Sphingomonas TaxID=196159 RepID=UPI002ADEAE32|nr:MULTISPECIES: glycine zipper 2TM domain-containing protein [unclassified Sphingomonas]MEA1073057.1 glycine zipper 2TM domain-containing protein [Sphingomonas sp. LY160]WRP26489.1 glycine zipper 2TM domain-containing protein [Sphingomonas sp. LY29]